MFLTSYPKIYDASAGLSYYSRPQPFKENNVVK